MEGCQSQLLFCHGESAGLEWKLCAPWISIIPGVKITWVRSGDLHGDLAIHADAATE